MIRMVFTRDSIRNRERIGLPAAEVTVRTLTEARREIHCAYGKAKFSANYGKDRIHGYSKSWEVTCPTRTGHYDTVVADAMQLPFRRRR